MVAVSDEISARVKQICKNVQNTNQIKEVLEELKTGDAEIIEESIDILFGVFSYHIVKKTWLETGEDQEKKDETALAKDIISSWLKTNFEYFLTILVSKISAVTSATQCTIFDKFLKLVSLENDHFWKGEFDVERKLLTRFDVLFNQLLDTNFTEELAGYMNELMENLDVQFLLIKKVHEVCASKNEDSSTSGLTSLGVDNCLKFLQLVSMNHINVKEDEAVLYFVKNDEFIRKNYRRSVEQAWLAFLRVENMSPVLRKKTLVDMDTKIIPFLSNPKILIDFLTDSYNAGGVTSLLALNGLFVLINEHNLDYPDFYTNLYKIIDASIFHMKYKSRFFHYIDMFLTSTHLPVYLIAAFIKKFSRMLLFTPSTDVLMVLTLIKNLLIRHTIS
uniref:CCAAT-binding factor domain-containing protein n=1 Tax=Clytia hemisphaerica TaxID=252671 RepID=A0A7M5XBQ3_9CNID